MTQTEQVEVTQADREKVAAWTGEHQIHEGKWDNHPLVQALARHRLTSTKSLRAENERLKVALVTAAIPLEALKLAGTVVSPEMNASIDAAITAIRQALATTTQQGETSDDQG